MNVASVVVTAIVIVLTGSVLLVGLAVGARRLLGLQLGVVCTVLAGVVGSAAWLAFGLAIARPQQRPFMLTTVQLGIALLVAMGFLVLAEAVLPSGSLRPVTWARALRHRLARARRYLQISRIAARHGLLPYLRGRRRRPADTPAGRAGLARSVRLALEEGGVSFVKLGQLLANRRDLLPTEFVNELSRLHHQVTPAPWPQVEQVLGQELGTPDAVFDKLDARPLDAAGPVIDTRGLDRQVLARALLGCLLRQIMLGGVFHADPHPGNILLLDDGRLALLDFGSVGRLDALLRSALQQFLLAIDRGDPAGLYDALLEVMVRPDDLDEQRLQRALGQFMARHLSPGAAPDVELFTDLFRLLASYDLMVPPEVAAVFRALATLEATLAQLAPGFDIVAESRAFAAAQLTSQLQPTSLRQAAS